MPSTFYLRADLSSLTAPGGSTYRLLSNRTGGGVGSFATNLTSGGTSIDATSFGGGPKVSWFTEAITTAVTISGTVTVRLRALESVATANAGLNIIVERTDNSGSVISTIFNNNVPDPVVEIATTATVYSDTYTPTSTSLSVGDRIRVTVQIINVGTMGTGFVNLYIGSQTFSATSTIEFDEDIVTDQPVDVGSYEIYGSNGYRR